MTNPTHSRFPTWIDPAPFSIARPALSTAGGYSVVESMAHQLYWRQNSIAFCYWFAPPPCAENPSAGEFHVMLWAPDSDRSDDLRQIVGLAQCWVTDNYHKPTGLYTGSFFKWYAPYNTASPVTVWEQAGVGAWSSEAGEVAPIQVPLVTGPMTWDPGSGSAPVHCKLEFQGLTVAALSLFHAPFVASETNMPINSDLVRPGRVLTPYGATSPGLGEIVHRVGDGNKASNHVETVTRRTLVNWGHPVGVWTDSAVAVQFGGADWTFPIRLRDSMRLGEGTDVTCVVGAVVSGDEGGQIDFSTSESGDSVSIAIPGGGSTYGVLVDEIDFDCGSAGNVGDWLTMTYRAAPYGEITIHSVFAFEAGPWV